MKFASYNIQYGIGLDGWWQGPTYDFSDDYFGNFRSGDGMGTGWSIGAHDPP